jgi:DNA-directed RNA polymerase specialized sigma subunit
MKLYQQNRSPGEDLVLAHLSLVKRVALHLKARVPAFMDLDELIQVGMIGLLEAARRIAFVMALGAKMAQAQKTEKEINPK